MATPLSSLVNAGVVMGVIHVLTGPDHLAAVATLSGADLFERRHGHLDGLVVGLLWGVGHSLGLLAVACALLIAAGDGEIGGATGPNEAAGAALEWVVGAGMLALGCWGLRRACRHRAPPPRVEGPGADCAAPDGHRASLASMELVTQMSEALNRDGDAMRDGALAGSGSRSGPGSGGEEEGADARLRRAAASLVSNSSRHSCRSLSRSSRMMSIAERGDSDEGESDSDDEEDSEEDRFLSNLSISAKSALSSSILDVLKKQSPPMMDR